MTQLKKQLVPFTSISKTVCSNQLLETHAATNEEVGQLTHMLHFRACSAVQRMACTLELHLDRSLVDPMELMPGRMSRYHSSGYSQVPQGR